MRKLPVALRPACWFDVRTLTVSGCLEVVLLFFTLYRPAFADPPKEKNILLLESYSERVAVEDSIKDDLRARMPESLNFYVEHLEGERFNNESYEKDVFETLRDKYIGQKFDLVMTQYYPALQFALTYRTELFPDVPIVFREVDDTRFVGQKMWAGVTGVTNAVQISGTIDLALHLHPGTDTVAIISDNDVYWLARVHAELSHYSKLREIDLVGLPTSELLDRVAGLPARTVVLFQITPQDSRQEAIGAYDILAWVGERLPTYCIFPILCLNHGGIGGVDWDRNEQASLAAGIAERVLSGEKPANIPVVNATGHQVRVDWRQLRHWNIAESALSPGSEVLYREPTLWERGRKYFLTGIGVMVAQALLIFALFWQRARKRKAEAVLLESEKRFRVMADSTPSLIWMCDLEGKVTFLNNRGVEFTGQDPGAGYGDTWATYVHPDDLKSVQDALSWALKSYKPFSKEYRLRRFDGVYRWIFDVAAPRMNGDGSFSGFIGSAIDMTDQKLAQQALEKVSGQLIEAQEKERRRIARELHDDISQKLALLSVEIQQADGALEGPASNTKQRLQEIRDRCFGIALDVQSLSHQLHSSKLDYLGVVAAIRGFCRELAQQRQLTIEFQDENVPSNLSPDISLCLFRVCQEALHNAVKYSGASQFAVKLGGTADEVQMVVSDAGAGFDVQQAKRQAGLGLVSMQERISLVRGRLRIESKPGEGTMVVAAVPLIGVEGRPSAAPDSTEPQGSQGAA